MKQLSLSEFIITIALLLGLAFGLHYALQTWLLGATAQTTATMERAERGY